MRLSLPPNSLFWAFSLSMYLHPSPLSETMDLSVRYEAAEVFWDTSYECDIGAGRTGSINENEARYSPLKISSASNVVSEIWAACALHHVNSTYVVLLSLLRRLFLAPMSLKDGSKILNASEDPSSLWSSKADCSLGYFGLIRTIV